MSNSFVFINDNNELHKLNMNVISNENNLTFDNNLMINGYINIFPPSDDNSKKYLKIQRDGNIVLYNQAGVIPSGTDVAEKIVSRITVTNTTDTTSRTMYDSLSTQLIKSIKNNDDDTTIIFGNQSSKTKIFSGGDIELYKSVPDIGNNYNHHILA